MSTMNNEAREFTVNELDNVSGGDFVVTNVGGGSSIVTYTNSKEVRGCTPDQCTQI
jgi:hypothetical protein